MSSVIYKYQILSGLTPMPRGARILSTGAQHGELFVWAVVDPEAPLVGREITVVGTGGSGHQVPDVSLFVDTVQIGSFVFHVFDLGEKTW
jgi:hypothetical protein